MECRISDKQMSIMDKLGILTDAAKYDVACTSSGTDRNGDGTGMGNAIKAVSYTHLIPEPGRYAFREAGCMRS